MRLLGVLLSLGLVLGLTLYVMDRVNEQEQRVTEDMPIKVLPGGIVAPATDPPAVVGGSAIDAAQTAACATSALTLRGAEDTYQVLNGKYADLPTLISEGLIRAPSENLYTIESDDGFATYRLVGQGACL